MLAETEDFDVLYDDEFVVIFVKDSAINNVPQILFVAFGEVHHSLCITLRRAVKALSFWVFSDAFEQCTDCSGELL